MSKYSIRHNASTTSENRQCAVSRLIIVLAFLAGCILSASLSLVVFMHGSSSSNSNKNDPAPITRYMENKNLPAAITELQHSSLRGLRILVAIAAFDFSQMPHLEEVIDAYQDLCVTGATKVDVVIHATVAYPVALIDMLNSRLLPKCENIFSLSIVLKPPSLRLHLVDCHRELFYQKLNNYDLFIYTEDDIRVTPTTVAAYLDETERVRGIVGESESSNFNVGIVRYEYNFPSNVIMDDKTRHATQNVTRVYWEHSGFHSNNPIPDALEAVPNAELSQTHVHMRNHHQGLFLATRFLLQAWKERPNCRFDEVRDRPGMKNRPSQPSEGTQRVWMSSQMLYGGRHCGVQQVIPVDSFGTLTVLHLPNKNYRRVGHYRNRTFSDGTEKFDQGDPSKLLTAMKVHLAIRRQFPKKAASGTYSGITMVDEVTQARSALLEKRLGWYQAYVDRGGVLNEENMLDLDLSAR
eukprot:scaffold5756_cov99-Cylindrotheca_fusiformis.AAC.2